MCVYQPRDLAKERILFDIRETLQLISSGYNIEDCISSATYPDEVESAYNFYLTNLVPKFEANAFAALENLYASGCRSRDHILSKIDEVYSDVEEGDDLKEAIKRFVVGEDYRTSILLNYIETLEDFVKYAE